MLNLAEQKRIRENTRNFYHIVRANAHLFGEPFLENDFLYYFDGEVATLVTPRIEGEITTDNINATIAGIVKKLSPQNLIVWGEIPTTDIYEQSGYQLQKSDLALWKREIVFDTSEFVASSKYRSYLRKAKAEGLKLKFVKSPFYKAEYTKLLMETHKNLLGIKSLSYYSIFPNLEDINYVEVIKNGQLVSVNVMVEIDRNYVCLAEVGYDKDFNRSSGLSAALLFEHYLDKAKYISWGGCSNEGIHKFKRELLGKTPVCFYDNYIWYEFYKDERLRWWLERMKKGGK